MLALFVVPSFSAMQAHPKTKAQKAQKEQRHVEMSADAPINLHTPAAPGDSHMGTEQVQVEVHALGSAALHAESCPKYQCQACAKCANRQIKLLRPALNLNCRGPSKCLPGRGDWCRNHLVHSIQTCEWNGDPVGITTIKACVTKMMCNAKGARRPCGNWIQANCGQQTKQKEGGKDEGGKQVCHGTTPNYNAWCNSNCNSIPRHCPSSLCSCSTSLAQAPPNTTQDHAALLARRNDKMTEEDELDGALSGKCGA